MCVFKRIGQQRLERLNLAVDLSHTSVWDWRIVGSRPKSNVSVLYSAQSHGQNGVPSFRKEKSFWAIIVIWLRVALFERFLAAAGSRQSLQCPHPTSCCCCWAIRFLPLRPDRMYYGLLKHINWLRNGSHLNEKQNMDSNSWRQHPGHHLTGSALVRSIKDFHFKW